MAPDNGSGPRVDLNLIPPQLLLPRLRAAGAALIGVGTLGGLLTAMFAPILVAVAVAAAVIVPSLFVVVTTARRHVVIEGTLVTHQGRLRTTRLDFTQVVTVEIVVRAGKLSQVLLRVGDGEQIVTVALALYTDDGGRELPVLGMRALADALSAAALAPAAAVASVLIAQLRSDARDALLRERPLFQAVTLVKKSGRIPETVLTDREVALLAG